MAPILKFLLAGWIAILLASCSSPQATRPPLPPPNIVFMIADDWSWIHTSVDGDPVVRTPFFDRLTREGVQFSQAYCAAPSCAPSRAAILTGRYPHQLESAGNLWSVFPASFPNWVSLLQEAGYHTGSSRKGWAPGDYKAGGYADQPAGKSYQTFGDFLSSRAENQAFCYWFGSYDPHRAYEWNSGQKTGMRLEDVRVPGFLPDLPCVRNDMLDYYLEVERFDRECEQIYRELARLGELDNTLIVMTSDNGMPFPRAKANLYDYGTRMPLVMRWPGKIAAGTSYEGFVNFVDFGPTFLESAGLPIPESMPGQSLWPALEGLPAGQVRDKVFLERERHANVREGDLSYPMRAVRTERYLYIRNFMPDRWPAGNPQTHQSVGQYGDIDNSITKYLIMQREGASGTPDLFSLSMGKRPAEELYDVQTDPYQLQNLIADPSMTDIRTQLQEDLAHWMEETGDIRATNPQSVYWDTVRYTPSYDFDDFNLTQEISRYAIKPLRQQDSIPCN